MGYKQHYNLWKYHNARAQGRSYSSFASRNCCPSYRRKSPISARFGERFQLKHYNFRHHPASQMLRFIPETQPENEIERVIICNDTRACQQGLIRYYAQLWSGIILTLAKNTRIRNKAVILLLLPITILLWLVGWSLFWTGPQNRLRTTKAAAETNPPITTGILLENYEEYNT